jgi:hypothetical protein
MGRQDKLAGKEDQLILLNYIIAIQLTFVNMLKNFHQD